MEYPALLSNLESLLRETCDLWEPGWVTFNWRAYTYDHVQRVRGLAVTLCATEGGNAQVTELAALLHDITKPYDGEYLTDAQGKRLVDEFGFWRNEVRRPVGANEVTAIYDRLNLAGTLHHESGAAVATELLRARGVAEPLIVGVARAIREHLLPNAEASLEGRCLYDADTIDANIGLPAFVRNIYINLHFHDMRKKPDAPSLDTILRDAPLDFLRPYVTENLPRWAEGKLRDFPPKLMTRAGRELSLARMERLNATFRSLADELADYQANSHQGSLAAMLHYMNHHNEPSIAAETRYLAQDWLSTNGATPQARAFLAQLQREIAGAE